MKKLLLILLICFAQNTFSQSKPTTKTRYKLPCSLQKINDDANKKNVVKPEFPGGLNKLYSFIKKNYRIPKAQNLKGKVYTTFFIEKDGSLTNIIILRDIGYGTGEEAIRVLKKSPKWIPATQNGKKIRYRYPLPIPIN